MLYAFYAYQFVGYLLDVARFPFDYKHFHTVVLVQVYVDGGDYLFMEMVLDVIEGVGKVMDVVAVDDGDRAYNFL